jgi:hypothetical protein
LVVDLLMAKDSYGSLVIGISIALRTIQTIMTPFSCRESQILSFSLSYQLQPPQAWRHG